MPIESTHRTYAYLYAAGKKSLLAAQATPAGSLSLCLQSNLLCALTIEAFANHVGAAHLAKAEFDVFDSASPIKKVRFLSHRLELSIDFGARPAQYLNEIIEFRNTLAHGRTMTVAGGKYDGVGDEPVAWPDTPWMKRCNLKTAWEWSDATKLLIENLDAPLRARAGLDYPHLWSQSDGEAIPDGQI